VAVEVSVGVKVLVCPPKFVEVGVSVAIRVWVAVGEEVTVGDAVRVGVDVWVGAVPVTVNVDVGPEGPVGAEFLLLHPVINTTPNIASALKPTMNFFTFFSPLGLFTDKTNTLDRLTRR
jgi:hypothetical protein